MKKFIAVLSISFVVLLLVPDFCGYPGAALSIYGLSVIALAFSTMAASIFKGKGETKRAMVYFAVTFMFFFLFGCLFVMWLPLIYAVTAIALWKIMDKKTFAEIDKFCEE